MHLMGAIMSYPRNAEIFGENEPAEYLYKVIGGAVRTYKILSDGRRQIGGFYLPGDSFGFQFAEEHTFSAEAITDAQVLVIKRSALTALAGRDATVARQLFALTSCELRRMQDHVLLLIKSRRARRQLPSRNGRPRRGRDCRGTADVARGHRRLSRLDHRDRVSDVGVPGKERGDRSAEFAAHRVAQPIRAEPPERLSGQLEI